ncbi:segregation and condensation protein A [Acidisoma sp. 7E03]
MTIPDGEGRALDPPGGVMVDGPGSGVSRPTMVEPLAAPTDGPLLDGAMSEQEGDRERRSAFATPPLAARRQDAPQEDVRAVDPSRSATDDWEDDAAWEAGGRRVPAPVVPVLHLDGFDGPMDLLLDLAERQRIDLGRLSIVTLVEQFLAAVDALRDRVALERRADWLVMATRLVLLRSRLLCPESPEAAQAAERDAAAELRRLDDLVAMRAAARWLGARPILGEVVFARGVPEPTGLQLGTEHTVDVIGFLWACLDLFDDDATGPETAVQYRPIWEALHSVAEARERILRILREAGEGRAESLTLDRFLPEAATETDEEGTPVQGPLLRASAWATTFSASLELAKQGEVAMEQEGAFEAVSVAIPPAG